MALKARLDTLEGLDESLAAEYKQDGDHFVLDVAAVDGFELRNTSGLMSALQKERDNNKGLTNKLEGFGDLDAEKAREALEQVEEMRNWTPDDKLDEKIRAREEQLVKKHGTELSKRDKTIDSLSGQLQDTLIKGVARSELAKHTRRVELLLPHVVAQVRAEFNDGKVETFVVDEAGNPRLTGKANSTDRMAIPELIETMRDHEEFAVLFSGTNAAGTGAENDEGGGGNRIVKWADGNAHGASIEDIAAGKVRFAK
ncbi:MAG: hypothetical protein GY856_36790 [bacterium]|nr:hypothetical protein [bacterium]